MKLIKELSEMIAEEIEGADNYAEHALMLKEEDPDLAKTFHTMAGEELAHAGTLHNAVVAVIEKYRKEHGDPPPSMLAVYDYLHEKQIKNAAKVRAMLSEYKA